jgi:hypothetical protein
LRRPPSSAHDPGCPGRAPDPLRQHGPKHEQTEDEQKGNDHAGGHLQPDHPLLHEVPAVLAVVGDVQACHERVHRAGCCPERDHESDDGHHHTGGGVVVQALQAVVEKRDRFFRCDLTEVLHEIADRVWAGDEREQAGRDKECRGYGEECAVGERGGDHWHVVIKRLLARAPDDCKVIALGQIGEAGVGLSGFGASGCG